MIKHQEKHMDKKWGSAEITAVVWIGLALLVLFPITLFLHGSFPFFTIIWLIVPFVIILRTGDTQKVGFRRIPWRKFLTTAAINLGLLCLISLAVEPWSHAYKALITSALSAKTPDTTFAWIINFTGIKAWSGLILYSGLVTIFGEELFFRGWLLQTLQPKMNKNLVIALQAALFTIPQLLAALVLSPLQGVIYIVIYSWLAVGVIGGWAAIRTQSIWPSLVSATVWNALMVALLR